MKWTTIAPTVDGWYWTRQDDKQNPIIQHVLGGKVNTGHLLIDANVFACQWYGPLKVPK